MMTSFQGKIRCQVISYFHRLIFVNCISRMASPPSTRGDHLTFTTSTSSANTPPFTSHSPNTSTNSRISHNLSDMLFGKPTTSGTSLSTSANESTPLLAEPPCHGGRTPRRNLTASLDQVAEAAAQNRVVKLNKISPISSESEEGEAGDGRLSRDRASITMAYAKKIKQRSKYYVPVTDWLPKYSWSLWVFNSAFRNKECADISRCRFSGDLVAGVSVACLLIPQVSKISIDKVAKADSQAKRQCHTLAVLHG